MSKDDLPASLSCDEILRHMFQYIEDWKLKLYDMISFNTATMAVAARQVGKRCEGVELQKSFIIAEKYYV